MSFIEKFASSVKSRTNSWRNQSARRLMPGLDGVDDAQFSLIHPVDGNLEREAKAQLVTMLTQAAATALNVDLSDVSERMTRGPRWPEIWPGEHYKLLSALVLNLKPKTVVEIGTFLGLSALAMKKFLPDDSELITFDIVNWPEFADTCFQDSDFGDGSLRQEICDLADPTVFEEHSELFSNTDLFFLDGPKNRDFEKAFMKQLFAIHFAKPALLVIDDIRLWSMVDIWRGIECPKLDATSLGHFSGTGLVLLLPK